MSIVYNLYRFGVDEFAVGHLINGDFPSDDEERWRIVDAPRYHIERLLNEHLQAQNILRACSETGRPFVLFLRSFSSEQKTDRIEKEVVGQISFHSIGFQKWLKSQFANNDIPLVKLHGGSDGFYTDSGDDNNILSTHAHNWKLVAEELVKAASAIIFLVSHMTPGVVEEFNLIREFQQTDRCMVVLLDSSETPDSNEFNVGEMKKSLQDFPNVFELRPPRDQKGAMKYPEELIPRLHELLKDAKKVGPLQHSVEAEFTYLEPHFTASEDYAKTEKIIWKGLRLLRVVFENKYWETLKHHGISFQHFKFPQHWIIAHQMYGLAIATADFKAIREALSYLSILYIFRGADLALLIRPLASKYEELAKLIFPKGEPDQEEQYGAGKDVLTFSNKMGNALEIFRYAQEADNEGDLETGMYLYQAAVISALKCEDSDEDYRKWVVANMCRDWAIFQSRANQPLWAVTNTSFSVKLLRDLVKTDAQKYLPDLALCLNNLGSQQFNLEELTGAEVGFEEALDIRRKLPADSENYAVNLYNSLANLGLLKVALSQLSAARNLYSEALKICDKEILHNPYRMGDQIRIQCWMCLCLSQTPGTLQEAREYAQLTAETFAKFSDINPDQAAAYIDFVKEAARISSEV